MHSRYPLLAGYMRTVTSESPLETNRARLEAVFESDACVDALGAKLVEWDGGRAVFRLAPDPRHLNFLGSVHGGALFSLADSALGVASNSWGRVSVALTVEIQFLSAPVDDVPRIVSRLQIGGTELEPDEPGPPPPGVPVIWVNAALGMTVGKAAAQVGHASMLYAAAHGPADVPHFAVRDADGDRWAQLCAAVGRGEAVAVRDAGFTEVAPGTITCIATSG